jgi:elongation factor 1-alpha
MVKEISEMFKVVGYKINNISISGEKEDNLMIASTNMPWYTVPTLIEALNNVVVPNRVLDKPPRMPIERYYIIQELGRVGIGKLTYGTLKPDIVLSLSKPNHRVLLRSIEMHYEDLKEARAGDIIGILPIKLTRTEVYCGLVAGIYGNKTPRNAISFEAIIIVTDVLYYVKIGYIPIVHCHTAGVPCKLVEIKYKLDKKN